MVATEVLGDLNGDGIVNIQDVVLIAASFGEAGENNADLNGDQRSRSRLDCECFREYAPSAHIVSSTGGTMAASRQGRSIAIAPNLHTGSLLL